MIKYTNVPMRFSTEKFGRAIRIELDALKKDAGVTVEEFAIIEMSISSSTIYGWINGKTPSMHNFLKVCNILGLDCREYFELIDEGVPF